MQWVIACPQQAGLRRHGGKTGETKLKLNTDNNLTLDVDATIIESDKGDGTFTYNGLIVGSEFRYGNESPQAGLKKFIENRFCGIQQFTITADQDVAV